MTPTDTIVAIATPPGTGGIAVLRLSGPQAGAIALRHLPVERLAPRHATFAHFSADGQFLDEVVATLYPAPHSYTGDEVVELSCHGSPFVQGAILQALVGSGARLAQPGEFTLRAFRAGKLGLAQAEAVADLIDAVGPAQHRLAVSQLRGGYAQRLKAMRQQLVDLAALLELELDFTDEDLEFADRDRLGILIADLQASAQALVESFALGNALKQGVPVAIVGEPNVGKSTLLNALLADDRAIVSPIPGTTRDTVEGHLTLGGITFRLIDTAGLRLATDEVERLGIERSRRAMADAYLVVEVLDATAPQPTPSAQPEGKRLIRVLNKCDLATQPVPMDNGSPCVSASAKQGIGIEQLKTLMLDTVQGNGMPDVLLSNVRHRDALLQMLLALGHAQEGLQSGVPTDLVAVDLRDALYHLGTITGEVASDEVLSSVFSRFCVGK